MECVVSGNDLQIILRGLGAPRKPTLLSDIASVGEIVADANFTYVVREEFTDFLDSILLTDGEFSKFDDQVRVKQLFQSGRSLIASVS
jgi:hypothetical protein